MSWPHFGTVFSEMFIFYFIQYPTMDQKVKNALMGAAGLFVLLLIIGALSGDDTQNASETSNVAMSTSDDLSSEAVTAFYIGVKEGLAVGKEIGKYEAVKELSKAIPLDADTQRAMNEWRDNANDLISEHNKFMREMSNGSNPPQDVILPLFR